MIASLRPEQIETGASVSIEHRITEVDIDAFAALTGDVSPLHMDADFARSRGFRGRVAHGVLLSGFVSRLFGVHLPGRDCLLQSMTMKWAAPACAGDLLRFSATVSQISPAAGAMLAEVNVENVETGQLLAKGKVQAGFTGDVT
ncbi:hypothetical protein A6A04_03410 [Paramagnetospirillum marisnigri]|uniref:MaoC-like domain-containing protein n=1 Tax=Paramagnetospirillum marisnigri TaxID=1285242 RepID=A0A178MM67_9PROT|nr:MaoC family dehydratase [Paramagnetospirillum marisnigri]OAN49175.1 hypothetical protein A6A04_03410 [Paramagnetospirillum marisnigri]